MNNNMNITGIRNELLNSLDGISVIDAHEHLIPEDRRISRKVDFFLLFSTYSRADLFSAGMTSDEYWRLRNDEDMPLEKKWGVFSQFYPMIKHGSYAKPARIWVKEVLGYDELTEKNYKEISERLQEWNKPGLYERILSDMCNIETALVVPNPAFQAHDPPFGYDEYNTPLLKPLWRAINYTDMEYIQKFLNHHKGMASITDYLDWMEEDFKQYMKTGVFGIKVMCDPFEKPDPSRADRIFRALQGKGQDSTVTQSEHWTLGSVIYDRAFQLARAHNLTVAVHSGVWGDFRNSQPTNFIPAVMNYPDISFDLFHLGMPYVREAMMIGKMFPNVSLNLCWMPVVSPELTCRMLDECLDMIPINNLIVFGADYNLPVEKVYGSLKMTKEVVARVLSKRILRGEMDLEEASRIAQMWFYDNPVRIYNL